MFQTASNGAGTEISPAIRRELGEVRSIRTATSSHESPSLFLLSLCSVPPNHQTPKAVEEEEDDADGEVEIGGGVVAEVGWRKRPQVSVAAATADRVLEGNGTNAAAIDTAHSNRTTTAAVQEHFILS